MNKFNNKLLGILSTGVLTTVLIVMSNISSAAVVNIDLWNTVGTSRFGAATTPGETIYVVANTSNSSMTGLTVTPGTEQRLNILVPPGIKSAAISQLAAGGEGYTGIASAFFSAAGPNQVANIPDPFSFTVIGNEPTGVMYSGTVIQPGNITSGTLILANQRSTNFTYLTVSTAYIVGDTQADVDNYNAWRADNNTATGGTSATGNTSGASSSSSSSSSTSSSSSSSGTIAGCTPVPFVETCQSSSSTTSTSSSSSSTSSSSSSTSSGESTATTSASSTATASETIASLVMTRVSGEIPDVSDTDITVKASTIIVKKSETESLSLQYTTDKDITALSGTSDLKGSTVDSGVVGASTIRGISFTSGGETIQADFYPAAYDGDAFKQVLAAIDGVSYVVNTTDGWMLAIMSDGSVYKAYYSDSVVTGGAGNGSMSFDVPSENEGDANGDGQTDYVIIYADGARQTIYFYLPQVVIDKAKLQADLDAANKELDTLKGTTDTTTP